MVENDAVAAENEIGAAEPAPIEMTSDGLIVALNFKSKALETDRRLCVALKVTTWPPMIFFSVDVSVIV